MTDEYRIESIRRVEVAMERMRLGGMVIMTDDENRENEGDLVCSAEKITPESVNFMAKEARGLICLTMTSKMLDKLALPMMEDSTKRLPDRSTAFTVSIEARTGVTTGISAHDRARTIQVAIHDTVTPEEIVVPGHIFPLKAKDGGVLQRAGHTEGSVDLAQLAGLKPAGVICEVMNDDGTMARLPDLLKFSEKHDIPIVTIEDIIAYRLKTESLIELDGPNKVLTDHGVFDGYIVRSQTDNLQHFVLVKGENFADKCVDVRVHNQRPIVDVFSNSKNGGRKRIDAGLQMLQDKDAAVLIYLTRPETMHDLTMGLEDMKVDKGSNKLRGAPMDLRQIGTGAQILRALGVKKMKIHTSSTRPIKGINGFGLEIVGRETLTENGE